HLPDRLQQLPAALHPPPPLQKHGEQSELRGSELETLASHLGSCGIRIDPEGAHTEDAAGPPGRGGILAYSPQNGAHTQYEFLGRKGLGYVIIRAEAQALDSILLLSPGGEE